MSEATQNSTPSPTPSEATISKQDIVREATNDPKQAEPNWNFLFAGREFTVVSLDYSRYIEFCGYLEPLFNAVTGKLASSAGVNLPGIKLEGADASQLMQFCKKDLPTMVAIICNMHEFALAKSERRKPLPSALVDAEWVMDNATSPWQLANIVFMQINKNNIISEFAAFFVQMLPVLTTLTKPTQPAANATPQTK